MHPKFIRISPSQLEWFFRRPRMFNFTQHWKMSKLFEHANICPTRTGQESVLMLQLSGWNQWISGNLWHVPRANEVFLVHTEQFSILNSDLYKSGVERRNTLGSVDKYTIMESQRRINALIIDIYDWIIRGYIRLFIPYTWLKKKSCLSWLPRIPRHLHEANQQKRTTVSNFKAQNFLEIISKSLFGYYAHI